MTAADGHLNVSDILIPAVTDQPHRPWHFARGAAGVRLMLAAARERRVPLAACLDGTGLTEGDLARPDLVVEAEQELRIARNLLRLTGDPPGLGVAVGRHAGVAAFGVWGYAILTSPTWADAFALALRYM